MTDQLSTVLGLTLLVPVTMFMYSRRIYGKRMVPLPYAIATTFFAICGLGDHMPTRVFFAAVGAFFIVASAVSKE